jgi:hypothetical protein
LIAVMTAKKNLSRLLEALAGTVVTLLVAVGLMACAQVASQPLPPDQLAANLAPLLKIEKRAEQVKYYALLLDNLGGIGEANAAAIKQHHDIYYVYYLAANFNLARGHIDSYLLHVRLAGKELDSMEAILKERIAALDRSDPEAGNQLSRFGL